MSEWPAWIPALVVQLVGIAVMVGMHWQIVAQHAKDIDDLKNKKADAANCVAHIERLRELTTAKLDRDSYLEAVRRLDGDIAQIHHMTKGLDMRLRDVERSR